MKNDGAKTLTSLAIVTLVIMGSFLSQEAWGQDIVSVDPTGTYLHASSNDNPASPTIVDLVAAGFSPNEQLKLSYTVAPPGFSLICGNPAFLRPAEGVGVLGVFSRSDNLLPKSARERVPDAINAGPDVGTSLTFFGNEPTDISEDFQISPHTGFTVEVPCGATHLFLGIADSFYRDNCGQVNVTITRIGGSRAPIVEQITEFYACGPPGVRSPRWGSFGPKQVLEADSGDRLVLSCVPGASVNYYSLVFAPAGGGPEDLFRVGTCPFQGGCNTGSFTYTGDSDSNGKPDCFLQTRWLSKDYSTNDTPNPWTGEDPSRALDHAETIFDVSARHIDKYDYKFTYAIGPPVPFNRFCVKAPPSLPEGSLVGITKEDPPLGPETEAFFDEVVAALQILPASDVPMGENPNPLCDLNEDGSCDAADLELLQNALHKCREDFHTTADIRADVDGDGCVTLTDQEMLISFDSDNDGILGFDDACPLSDLSTTVIIDGCNSEVPNTSFSTGCTISDQLTECAASARNHGAFVSCVAQLTNELKKDGVITGQQKGAIQSCAAQANIP